MDNCESSSECSCVAIDLGARNSYVAAFVNGSINIFPNIDEKRYVPSIVTVKREKRLVGLPALNTIPSNIIYDACQMHVASPSTNKPVLWYANSTNYQYTLKDASNEHVLRQQEVIAMVLDHLKTAVAEKQLGCVVQKAVICVPSFADNLYRSTVFQAAEISGFKEVHLLNQSTAVAMAFKMDHLGVTGSSSTHQKPAEDIKFAVVNIGANCTEASVFNIRAVDGQVQLLSTCGDANVGGEQFTNCLVNMVLDHLQKRPDKDESMLTNKKSIKIVRDACEKAKIDLSSFNETGIFIDIFGTEYNIDKFRRMEFEAFCSNAFDQVEGIIAKGLQPHSQQISSLLLVGGASRMPKIKHIVGKYISRDYQLVTGIVAEEAAVIGATIQASLLTGHSTLAHAYVHDFAYNSIFAKLPEVSIKVLDRCDPIPTIRTRQPNIRTGEQEKLAVQLITDTNEMLGNLDLKKKSSVWVNLDSNGVIFVNLTKLHSQPQLVQYPSLFKPNSSDLKQAKFRIQQYREGISSTKVSASDSDPKQTCAKEGDEHRKNFILEKLHQIRKEKEEEKKRKDAIQAQMDQQMKELEKKAEPHRQKEASDRGEQQHSAMQTKTAYGSYAAAVSMVRLPYEIEISEPKKIREVITGHNIKNNTETGKEVDTDEDFFIVDAEECEPRKVTQRKENGKAVVGDTKPHDYEHMDHNDVTKDSENTLQQEDKENLFRCYNDRLLAIRQSVVDNTTELSTSEKTTLTKKCCYLLHQSFDTKHKLHSHFEVCVAEAERLLALNDSIVAVNKIDDFVHENTIQTDTHRVAKKVYGLKKNFNDNISHRRLILGREPPIQKQQIEEMFEAFVDNVKAVIPDGHPLHGNNKLSSLFQLSFVELDKKQQQ